jgi:metal-responsive CopG/Arc/MetJ family transcriptional regulator
MCYNHVVTVQRRGMTVRFDDDLLRGMDAVWHRDGVAPSEQVRRALRAWLATKDVNVGPLPNESERARAAWAERRKKYGPTGRRS